MVTRVSSDGLIVCGPSRPPVNTSGFARCFGTSPDNSSARSSLMMRDWFTTESWVDPAMWGVRTTLSMCKRG